MDIIYQAKPYKEHQATTNSSTASTAIALQFDPSWAGQNLNQEQLVYLEARGDNIVFCFGGSGVASTCSKTVNADGTLALGNYSVPEGALIPFYIQPSTENYYSAIGEAGTGVGIVRTTRKRV